MCALMLVGMHMCAVSIQGCVYVCVFASSCQATKVLIGKYLATRRVVVSVGGSSECVRKFNCLQV